MIHNGNNYTSCKKEEYDLSVCPFCEGVAGMTCWFCHAPKPQSMEEALAYSLQKREECVRDKMEYCLKYYPSYRCSCVKNQEEIERGWLWDLCSLALESDSGWKHWQAGNCYYKSRRHLTFNRPLMVDERLRLGRYFGALDCGNRGQEWSVKWPSTSEVWLEAGVDSSD